MKHYIRQAIITLLQITTLWAVILILICRVLRLSFDVKIAAFLFLFLLLMILWLNRFIRTLHRGFILRFTIKQVDVMDGTEFEEYVKAMLENLGFRVEMTKTSHDYGADLILYKKRRTIAVQCKRYHTSIGVKAIQEVIGSMAYYQANRGLVITNSYYTKNAQNLASVNDVILWDRNTLLRMMEGDSMSQEIRELLIRL